MLLLKFGALSRVRRLMSFICCVALVAYVMFGKTSRPLKNLISEHRCAIRHRDPKSPVAQHFANSRHLRFHLSDIGIEAVKCPAARRRYE